MIWGFLFLFEKGVVSVLDSKRKDIKEMLILIFSLRSNYNVTKKALQRYS